MICARLAFVETISESNDCGGRQVALAIPHVNEVIARDYQQAVEPPIALEAKREKASSRVVSGGPRFDIRAVERMFEHVSVADVLEEADIGRVVGRLKIDLVMPCRAVGRNGRDASESALASE